MTNRSRGVLKTRCSAIVNSTTPRFGPRCPPVCDRTLINSSRTSCASWGRSCSRNALISAGELIPSSKRFGAVVAVVLKESDFVILFFFSFGWLAVAVCIRGRFKIFHDRFAGAIAGDDLDLLFGAGKPFLTHFHQPHSFLITHNQILKRQFARFHLFDNRLQAIHRLLEVQLRARGFRFAAHEEWALKHTVAPEKSATCRCLECGGAPPLFE